MAISTNSTLKYLTVEESKDVSETKKFELIKKVGITMAVVASLALATIAAVGGFIVAGAVALPLSAVAISLAVGTLILAAGIGVYIAGDHQARSSLKNQVNEIHDLHSEHIITDRAEAPDQEALVSTKTVEHVVKAYNSGEPGWVFVPPKQDLDLGHVINVASGAIGFEGNGRWKIHVSISPQDIEKAIPLIIKVLHSKDAPRLGFKMQTKANLSSTHQIGKELAIIFDKQVEEDILAGKSNKVQPLLNALHNEFRRARISPEKGLVLTPQTMNQIKDMPAGKQIKEKLNLKCGKFDRAIPSKDGINHFFYRDEHFVPMRDDEIGDLRGIEGVYAASDIIKLARETPIIAHNPTGAKDPFLRLVIKNS